MKAVPRRSRMSLDLFALRQAVGEFDQRALGVAEEQQVGLESGRTERRTLSDQ
jgi:hypothetical protein